MAHLVVVAAAQLVRAVQAVQVDQLLMLQQDAVVVVVAPV
jgi:hypothetical protein